MTSVEAQDMEDGRALRELREALPEACFGEVFIAPKGYQVKVMRSPWHDEWDDVVVKGGYSTIAEAADACRAALVKP